MLKPAAPTRGSALPARLCPNSAAPLLQLVLLLFSFFLRQGARGSLSKISWCCTIADTRLCWRWENPTQADTSMPNTSNGHRGSARTWILLEKQIVCLCTASHTRTLSRLQRKTRAAGPCLHLDPPRNTNFMFMETNQRTSTLFQEHHTGSTQGSTAPLTWHQHVVVAGPFPAGRELKQSAFAVAPILLLLPLVWMTRNRVQRCQTHLISWQGKQKPAASTPGCPPFHAPN